MKIPARRRVKPEISETERANLLSIAGLPGYQVLLDVMERVCIQSETEHFRLSRARGATTEMICASHDIVQAQRIFFERLQRLVEAEKIEGTPAKSQPAEPFSKTYERSLTGS